MQRLVATILLLALGFAPAFAQGVINPTQPGGAANTVQTNGGNGRFSGVGPGTATTVLHGNASGAPSFGAVDLGADITGVLPAANGGTFVTPQEYDANAGNGTADGGAAINSAIASGNPVFIPCGDYKLTTQISITQDDVFVLGAGYCAHLDSPSATTNDVTIGDGTNTYRHITLANLRVSPSATKTLGAAVYVSKGNQIILDHIWGDGTCYNSVTFDQFAQAYVLRSDLSSCANDGITYFGSSDNLFGVNGYVDKATFVHSMGRYGVHIGGGANVYLDNQINNSGSYGILLDTALGGVNNREIFLGPGLQSDSNTGANFVADTNSFTTLDVNGSWFNGSASVGMLFNGQTGDINIKGAIVQDNASHGIQINNTLAGLFELKDTKIKNNGTGGTGWGMILGSGTVSNANVQINTLSGNASGGISGSFTPLCTNNYPAGGC